MKADELKELIDQYEAAGNRLPEDTQRLTDAVKQYTESRRSDQRGPDWFRQLLDK